MQTVGEATAPGSQLWQAGLLPLRSVLRAERGPSRRCPGEQGAAFLSLSVDAAEWNGPPGASSARGAWCGLPPPSSRPKPGHLFSSPLSVFLSPWTQAAALSSPFSGPRRLSRRGLSQRFWDWQRHVHCVHPQPPLRSAGARHAGQVALPACCRASGVRVIPGTHALPVQPGLECSRDTCSSPAHVRPGCREVSRLLQRSEAFIHRPVTGQHSRDTGAFPETCRSG